MKPDTNKEAVAMTQKAIDHVYTLLTERGYGIGLRLGVKTLGCSGYSYNIGFLDKAEASDQVFDINPDIKIAIDKSSYPIIKGTLIDFVSEGLNRQFTFNNPNAKDLCGCGESFSV